MLYIVSEYASQGEIFGKSRSTSHARSGSLVLVPILIVRNFSRTRCVSLALAAASRSCHRFITIVQTKDAKQRPACVYPRVRLKNTYPFGRVHGRGHTFARVCARTHMCHPLIMFALSRCKHVWCTSSHHSKRTLSVRRNKIESEVKVRARRYTRT